MAEAKATVPHFYVESEIDMTRALELRAELNAGLADSGEKVSVNDLIVRACALGADRAPAGPPLVRRRRATSTTPTRTSASRSRWTTA